MRTLCVIFGAVLLLFSGVCLINYQQPIKKVTFERIPTLGNWLSDIGDGGFSVSASTFSEPRALID